ncbi:cytochrome c oxidase assembly protein COX18, mitochondrial-like [Leptopilina heterotoma]|uniref:cytochrome c oxidase assembly protein COX18, mitochondrial-like n=1 Tax=Leptopilina heterotoma TaxID=63436 RepID=UPI001CA7CA6E|nr:cytochrome c oxidase assembly protein COX18, mitochondrial-like [Leptopilina heterotoma]
MYNLITGSFLRYSVREIQRQKCSLSVNVYKKNVPAFITDNCYSPQQITNNHLSIDSVSSDNTQSKIINFNKSHSYHCQSELRSGILKSGLFKNSLRLPLKLNVRYESSGPIALPLKLNVSSSELPDTDTLSEIAEEVSESGFFDYDVAVNAILKDLSESPLANVSQEFLQSIHNVSGLPWWGTIILATITLKTVVYLPFAVQQRRAIISLENAQKSFNENLELLRQEITMSMKKLGWPVEYSKTKYKEMMKEVWKRALKDEKTHPIKAIACVSVQFTTWLAMTVALGNMCCAYSFIDLANVPVYSELTTGGIEWLTNLTVPDSSLLLPIAVGAINLSIVALYYTNYKNPTIIQKSTSAIFGLLSLGSLPLAMQLPSGVVLYWLGSSLYGLIFNLILLTSTGQKVFRIPKLKTQSELKHEAKDKFSEHQEKLHSNLNQKKLKQKYKEI